MRRLLLLLVALAVLLLPAGASALRYYNALPVGTVLTSQPDIGLQIFPQPGDVVRVDVQVDAGPWRDVPIAADGGAFYVPPQPLAPGPHTASVVLSGAHNGTPYQTLTQFLHFTVAAGARPLPGMSVVDLGALRQLNADRAAVGLPPAAWSPNLQAASRAHAAYFVANAGLFAQADMHTEPSPSAPGFSGATPLVRDAAFGALGGSEVMNVTCPGGSGAMAVDELMDTVFHRLAMLSAGLATAGGDAVPGLPCTLGPSATPQGDPFVMDMALLPTPQSGAMLYPADGQTGVPTELLTEVPSPLPAGANPNAGYPVTAQLPGAGPAVLTSATLTADGEAVPVYTLDSTWRDTDPIYTGEQMGNAVAVIPQAPMAPDTTYAVHLTGTDPAPFDLRWSFTTAAESATAVWTQGGAVFAKGDFACPGPIDGGWAALVYCSRALAVSASGQGMPAADAQPPFADAAADSWATLAINTAWGLGIAQGVGPGVFAPDATLTEAQALALLARSRGADVSGGTWAEAALGWAQQAGVLLPAEAYVPDAPATRARFVAWLARAWQVPLDPGASPTFADAASVPAADAPAVAWAQQAGVAKGTGGNDFLPAAPLTRAQAVAILVRLLL